MPLCVLFDGWQSKSESVMNLNIRPGPIQIFLLAMLVVCPLSAQSQGQVLSLETALEIALSGNLSVMNAELEIDSTADDVAAIKTRRLPKLELGASYRDNLKPQDYLFEEGVWGT